MTSVDETVTVPPPSQDGKGERRLSDSQRKEVEALTVGQLMWLRFRRSRLAIYSGVFLIFLYTVAILAPFFASYDVRHTHDKYPGCPPHPIRFLDKDGRFHLRPFVYGLERKVDPDTFESLYIEDTSQVYPLRLFLKGDRYIILGFIRGNLHLFGVDDPGKLFMLGTDSLGRDLLSRIIFGSQVSLTVGLMGVLLSIIIGSLAGVASGMYGGTTDEIVQRLIEFMMSFPRIPLWIALASILPPNWSSIKIYFGITVVLSMVGWGYLARQVRGKVLALREQDFVTAARLAGCSDLRIIVRHLFPNTLSHVLVVATLAIPGMILGETALSFLGLGIRPPMTSWGVLLAEAQKSRVLLTQPWLVLPALFVIVTVIAFNFLGDGLRDAADPFAQ
ncbi:MAG: ABC transporter permease [Anaerolineae bacterium]